MNSVLTRTLPCSKCGAAAGAVCVRRDGAPMKDGRSHGPRTPTQPCGSNGGYQRHLKNGETPCGKCRDARRRYMSEYRDRNPEVRDSDIALLRARKVATRLLIERHRDEFRRLMDEATA